MNKKSFDSFLSDLKIGKACIYTIYKQVVEFQSYKGECAEFVEFIMWHDGKEYRNDLSGFIETLDNKDIKILNSESSRTRILKFEDLDDEERIILLYECGFDEDLLEHLGLSFEFGYYKTQKVSCHLTKEEADHALYEMPKNAISVEWCEAKTIEHTELKPIFELFKNGQIGWVGEQ